MTQLDRRTFLAGSLSAVAASGAAAQEELESAGSAEVVPGKTPNTRFAVNIEMWFRRLPFLDRIRASADLGFPAVEFWGLEGKDLEATAKLCQELGIEVAQFTAWGFVPGLNDPRNHDSFLAAAKAAVAAADVLGARKATVVGGNDQPGMTPGVMHQNIIDGLKLAAPIVEEGGLMLILEPMNVRVDHKGHCLFGSSDAVRICREVNSAAVKINWDLYHMQISEGDLCGHLREGFDQVGYVQLADHPGRNEPGTGEIQFGRVLRELRSLGYEDFVGLECWPQSGEELAARRVLKADSWQT
jgi:hydroxypyruvate isomerase